MKAGSRQPPGLSSLGRSDLYILRELDRPVRGAGIQRLRLALAARRDAGTSTIRRRLRLRAITSSVVASESASGHAGAPSCVLYVPWEVDLAATTSSTAAAAISFKLICTKKCVCLGVHFQPLSVLGPMCLSGTFNAVEPPTHPKGYAPR